MREGHTIIQPRRFLGSQLVSGCAVVFFFFWGGVAYASDASMVDLSKILICVHPGHGKWVYKPRSRWYVQRLNDGVLGRFQGWEKYCPIL